MIISISGKIVIIREFKNISTLYKIRILETNDVHFLFNFFSMKILVYFFVWPLLMMSIFCLIYFFLHPFQFLYFNYI